MESVLDVALSYAEKGWPVLPLKQNSKEPATAHGVNDATTDTEIIKAWFTRNPDFNIGIAAGNRSGLIVFDIDPRNGGSYTWDEWIQTNGRITEYAMQITAGGGAHFLAQYDPEIKSCKLGEGIDLLSDGKYFVAHPSTINGRHYDWEADSDPLEGSEPFVIPDKWKQSILGRKRNSSSESKSTGAIIEGNRNAGLTALAGAMRSWGMAEPEILSALSTVNELRCNPPLPTSEIRTIAKSVSRYEADGDLAADTAIGDQMARDLLKKLEEKKPDYFFTRASEFLRQPAPIDWAVKRWVPTTGIGMMYGESGIGKTFVAIDMACSLATGQDWMGQKTKAGVVVYLAGEGNYGLRQRITAWASHHDNYNLDNLLISNRAIDLDAPNASAEILRCIKEMDISERVVMVVVDTMNRHMSGDENSAKDIRALVNACSVVQAATGGAVMLVHHTGHGEGARNRARGSSNIKASLDFSFMVSREGEAVLISCDKMKDAREPDKLICKLQEVSLGWLDADGNLEPPAAVALLMDKMPESQPKVQPFNKGEQAAIAAYRNVAEIDGILNDDGTFGGISLEQWRPEFYKLFEGSYDAKKKAFKRARETMAERGEISEADGMVMLTGEFAAIDNSVFVKKLQVLRNLGDRGTRGTKGDN